jgi:hypothetical protein
MSDCPHCRTFARENNKLMAELGEAQAEILKQIREKGALRAQRTKQLNADAINASVMAVLRMWRSLCSPRSSIAITGKNAEAVRVAFVNYVKGSPRQKRHMLYDAVHGAALRPYDEGYGHRTANPAGSHGQGAVRRVTTAHIFASEERIESFAGYWRFAQAQPYEWKWRAYGAARDLQELWFYLAMQELHHRPVESSLYVQEPAVDPETTTHLFLDEVVQESAAPEVERPRLFVVKDSEAA